MGRKTKTYYLAFIFILTFSLPSQANSPNQSAATPPVPTGSTNNPPQRTGSLPQSIKELIGNIPLDQARGVQEYLEAIGHEAEGGANTGIISYNDRILENNCLERLATRFYGRIRERHQFPAQALNQSSAATIRLNRSLNSSSSSPAGFAWAEAMEFSGNDGNLAMQLLGICGHDDYQTAVFTSAFQVPFKSRPSLICPRVVSPFYTPGSLGSDVDISPDLKNRIVEIQTSNGDASRLPAKYYHVMGAAYTSCILARRNVPKPVAELLNSRAVNGYRAGRLCKDLLFARRSLESLEDRSTQDILNDLRKYAKQGSDCNKDESLSFCYIEKNDLLRELAHQSVRPIHASSLPEDVKEREEQRVLVHIRRQLGQSLALKELNSSPSVSRSFCSGPQITDTVRNEIERLSNQRSCRVLTRSQCEQVTRMARTWSLDFEWSQAQHRVGLDFAYRHCKPLPSGTSHLQGACARARAMDLSAAEGSGWGKTEEPDEPESGQSPPPSSAR
jgi:hypothetical protein